MNTPKNIVLLAGGVGGAKAAKGLYHSTYKEALTVIGNVGDDDNFHNLWVSPDLETSYGKHFLVVSNYVNGE